MKEKASEHWREWEKEAKEFINTNYPFNRAWVRENLEVLNGLLGRRPSMSRNEVVDYAIRVTEDFARQSGIGLRPESETTVIHLPSRLEAIRRFEGDVVPSFRKLSLDRMVRILILAEAASVQESVDNAWVDVTQDHLGKLTELVSIHKDFTGL